MAVGDATAQRLTIVIVIACITEWVLGFAISGMESSLLVLLLGLICFVLMVIGALAGIVFLEAAIKEHGRSAVAGSVILLLVSARPT